MPDRKDHATASSSKRKESSQQSTGRFWKRGGKAAVAEPAKAAAAHAASRDDVTLSRNWGAAGIQLTIKLNAHEAQRLVDCRLLWGVPSGFDGYSLVPFVRTDANDGSSIAFAVPAQATPGIYAIQLQNGSHFVRRFQFVVSAKEPPETSPFRILRTDPRGGALRMYMAYDRNRENPEVAVEEVAALMKRYDTFLQPVPDDPEFKDILNESLPHDEKREMFATWLVNNQLEAEKGV